MWGGHPGPSAVIKGLDVHGHTNTNTLGENSSQSYLLSCAIVIKYAVVLSISVLGFFSPTEIENEYKD